MTQILGGSIVALVGVALALMTKRQRWTRNPCRIVSQPSAEDVVISRAANNVRRVMKTGAVGQLQLQEREEEDASEDADGEVGMQGYVVR